MNRAFVLALCVLATTACGAMGDNGGGGSAGSEGSTDSQRAIQPEAQQRAESLLLRLSDLPDGWFAGPPGDETFEDCIRADPSAFTIIGEADSDNFAAGDKGAASSNAEVFETEEMAAAAAAEFVRAPSSDVANACLTDFMDKYPATDDLTAVEFGEFTFTPRPASMRPTRGV